MRLRPLGLFCAVALLGLAANATANEVAGVVALEMNTASGGAASVAP